MQSNNKFNIICNRETFQIKMSTVLLLKKQVYLLPPLQLGIWILLQRFTYAGFDTLRVHILF